MKAIAALLLAILPAAALGSQAIDRAEAMREMGVSLDLPADIEMLPPVEQADLEYQVAYRFTGARYEVRISLFPQSWLVRQSCDGDIDQYVPLLAVGLLAAIAKDSLYFCKSADLPAPIVRKEFGADRGMTALVKGNRSDFGRGYTHIAVAFLYKAGSGVVMVSFLYNEPRDLQMEGLDFSQAYYCFRFNESIAEHAEQ
jgi:hypothetical protein